MPRRTSKKQGEIPAYIRFFFENGPDAIPDGFGDDYEGSVDLFLLWQKNIRDPEEVKRIGMKYGFC